MQKRHDFNVLAMELRLLCIKPPKLYVNSSRVWEHIGIRWGYKSEAKWGNRTGLLFVSSATLSEAIKQAVVAGCTCGCHTRYDKHKPSQRPQSSYHKLQLQWVTAMSYCFHKHGNWYSKRHYDWYLRGHSNHRYIHKKIKRYLSIKWTMIWWTKYAGVVSPLVSLLDIGNQWPFANHRPLPRLSFRL